MRRRSGTSGTGFPPVNRANPNSPRSVPAALIARCALALCAAAPAAAQNAPDANPPAQAAPAPAATASPADLPALIRDLDAASIQTRIAAQNRLATSPGISLHDIEAAFKNADLSPEQRERLLSAAYKRFCSEPRAAMGVGPGGVIDQQHGALLQLVNDKFPAAAVLRTGDRVIAADGHPIEDFNALRPVILSHDPGDEMPVTIIRAGATLNLTVKLASYADLLQLNQPGVPQPNTPEPSFLAAAWQIRSKPFRESSPAANTPIPCSLTSSNWVQASYEDSDVIRGRVVDPDQARTEVVAGGEARGGVQPPNAGVQRGGAVGADGQIRILMPQPQGADAARVQLEQQRLIFITMRQSAAEQVIRYRQQLVDPKTPEPVRKQLKSLIEIKTRELQLDDERIQQLTIQITNLGK